MGLPFFYNVKQIFFSQVNIFDPSIFIIFHQYKLINPSCNARLHLMTQIFKQCSQSTHHHVSLKCRKQENILGLHHSSWMWAFGKVHLKKFWTYKFRSNKQFNQKHNQNHEKQKIFVIHLCKNTSTNIQNKCKKIFNHTQRKTKKKNKHKTYFN